MLVVSPLSWLRTAETDPYKAAVVDKLAGQLTLRLGRPVFVGFNSILKASADWSSYRGRTRRKGIEALYQHFFEKLDTAVAVRRPLHIAVLHGGVPEDAAMLAERIRQEYQPAELLINITGPVLGLHTGLRALALCGYSE